MKKILKEPLLHFLVLGGLIYFVAAVWGDSSSQQQKIIVSEGQIKHLETLYRKTWQRKPSKEELDNVVQEYVLEQAAYYEGLNLGLDKNDIVIIRRVHQKLDFIAEESRPRPEVGDEVLKQFLHDNAHKFREEPLLTIRQIFLDPKVHGDFMSTHAAKLIARLNTDPEQDIRLLGERYLFKPDYENINLSALGLIFGREFALFCNKLPLGQWSGLVSSAYGDHLIYVDTRKPGRLPELAEIRSQVLSEWESAWREDSVRSYYRALLARYPVTIHWPKQAPLGER